MEKATASSVIGQFSDPVLKPGVPQSETPDVVIVQARESGLMVPLVPEPEKAMVAAWVIDAAPTAPSKSKTH